MYINDYFELEVYCEDKFDGFHFKEIKKDKEEEIKRDKPLKQNDNNIKKYLVIVTMKDSSSSNVELIIDFNEIKTEKDYYDLKRYIFNTYEYNKFVINSIFELKGE
jgi:hypothetical protein